ncbi:MAG: hypothetical protein IJ002_02645 [Clostridia bacterium]|nr:hypothetical protein [Clostridia bacterium]
MFDVKYDIVEETYRCENEVRTAYGIVAYDAKNGVCDVFEALHDISDDKEKVCELAYQCNKLGLDLEHMEEVVTDFLNE